MKYFCNISTLDELKKKFRELCLTMHPDKGGNAAEFQAMSAEFEQVAKGMSGTKQHAQEEAKRQEEEARRREQEEKEAQARAWQEEERKRREEEERREAERIAKAQEETRAAVRAWAHILERMPETISGKIRGSYFTDNKSRAAYVAIVKRNVKAVINHYFPGLKVSVTISGAIWKEDFCISWVDGPSVAELRNTCKELSFFIPAHYESDPYADYGNYCNNEGTAPWREAFGGALGDATKLDYNRTLSEEGKAEAEQAAAAIFANWTKDTDHGRGLFAASLDEWVKFAYRLGMKKEGLSLDLYGFGMSWGQYANNDREEDGHSVGDFYFSSVRRLLREKFTVTAQPKEKEPEFVPTYGKTYKAIKKVMGQNVFFINQKDSRKNAEKELSIFEAAERLAKGEGVNLGKRRTWDDEPVIYGTDRGGYKTQQKRAAKYEEVGIILEGVSYNTYGIITALGIKPETLEALRREAQNIERQRKAWEEAQNAPKDEHQESKPQEATTDAAPAEGLQLVEIAGGVAVVGDKWTTYKNRREIKAHGAKWNTDAKRWEATDPESVAQLRQWFGMSETTQDPTHTATATPESMAGDEETAKAETMAQDDPKAPTAEAVSEKTTTPQDDESAAAFAGLVASVAELFGVLSDIMTEAKRWEGVTIAPETLQRWQSMANDNAKTAAAKLCEVCACLGSLTPDRRHDFDALGVIFWTLSEQLKQGAAPEGIAAAVEYGRAQLCDLIERTQTAQQAAAVRGVILDDGRAAA